MHLKSINIVVNHWVALLPYVVTYYANVTKLKSSFLQNAIFTQQFAKFNFHVKKLSWYSTSVYLAKSVLKYRK